MAAALEEGARINHTFKSSIKIIIRKHNTTVGKSNKYLPPDNVRIKHVKNNYVKNSIHIVGKGDFFRYTINIRNLIGLVIGKKT